MAQILYALASSNINRFSKFFNSSQRATLDLSLGHTFYQVVQRHAAWPTPYPALLTRTWMSKARIRIRTLPQGPLLCQCSYLHLAYCWNCSSPVTAVYPNYCY